MGVSHDAKEDARTNCGSHLQWPTLNDLLYSVRPHFLKAEDLANNALGWGPCI